MKKFIRLLLFGTLLFFISFPAFSFTLEKQFEETAYNLRDICLVNDNVGWAVGTPHWSQDDKAYKGTIIKTVDGGVTWSAQDAGVTVSFRAVYFVDSNNGWVSGANGTILHTSDGGDHWEQQPVATTDEIRDITFSDTLNGWAISNEPLINDSSGNPVDWQSTIWHTINGGITWSIQTLPADASFLHGLKFLDSNTGWAVGIKCTVCSGSWIEREHVAVMYHTSNGGATWTEQWSPDLDLVFTAVEFSDPLNGWAVGFKGSSSVAENPLYHTSDGGITWVRQSDMDPAWKAPPGDSVFETLWDVRFLDQNRGYIVGMDTGGGEAVIYRTLSGGVTWESFSLSSARAYGVGVQENKAIAVGNYDFEGISSLPWSADPQFFNNAINLHYKFEDVFFINDSDGWAVGAKSYEAQWSLLNDKGQVIFNTNDGGTSWQIQYETAIPTASFHLNSVFFVDTQNGWVVGASNSHHNLILHTSDGGANWVEQGTELIGTWDIELTSVFFIDSQNGWATVASRPFEDNIYIAHTTNGGGTWNWVDTGVEGGLGSKPVDVVFTDSQHGWIAIDANNMVIYTEDGGSSWVSQPLPDYNSHKFAMEFIDNQIGWITGENKFFHTTDGGTNWMEIDTNFADVDFYGIQFVDADNGIIVGEWGNVYETSDGGDNWINVAGVTYSNLNGVSFPNSENAWIAGDNGTILHAYRRDIYLTDVIIVLQVTAGLEPLGFSIVDSDLNDNGKLDMADAIKMLRMVAGIVD